MYSRSVEASQFDENIEIGRFLHEINYTKNIKEVDFINTTIKYNDFHKNVSYRRISRLQIYHLQKHILEGDNLKFFWSKW